MGKAKKEEDVTERQDEQAFAESAEDYHPEIEEEAEETSEAAEDLADELDALRAERDMLRDRFMRALADAENSRKRGERDRREAEQYGGSKLARDMLPVYDALRRALETMTDKATEADKAVLEGIELTMRELTNVFRKHGIEPIDPAPGDVFDPQVHQAMFEAPVPGTKAGDILQVMAVGFMIHDRLLRPAQVGVSSTPKS
jgi:molecular chaperone GrpE